MPRRGIHPLLRTATLVLRNGASITIETVAPATKPVMLSVVSWKEEEEKSWFFAFRSSKGTRRPFFFPSLPLLFFSHLLLHGTKNQKPKPHQDPTVHPRWTGDASAVASEDGRLAKFARKFEGGVVVPGGGGVKKEK